jgi:hypothetical protein
MSWAERPFQWRKIMKGRWMMVLATALLAGSLVATGAQARGGGGGGGGHGGGFGGGFGGAHMGSFGGAGIGGFDGGHMGAFSGARIGSSGMGRVAGIDWGHVGMGRRHFGGIYDYDLGCPYYPAYTAPYCTYNY